MSASRNRPYPGLADSDSGDGDWPQIAWINTDSRRAPLRNDVIDGLGKSIPVALLWLVFSGVSEPLPRAVSGAFVVGLVFFALGFMLSWGQMITARRPGATVRSARAKLGTALVEAVLIGVTVLLALSHGSSPTASGVALALGAAIVTAAIVMGLERFAIDVPAASELAGSDASRVEYRWGGPWQ